jgi:hypothetical protein
LPDLQFRLVELYVEKSRYVYFLRSSAVATTRSHRQPETKLKQKAVCLNWLLREFPTSRRGQGHSYLYEKR